MNALPLRGPAGVLLSGRGGGELRDFGDIELGSELIDDIEARGDWELLQFDWKESDQLQHKRECRKVFGLKTFLFVTYLAQALSLPMLRRLMKVWSFLPVRMQSCSICGCSQLPGPRLDLPSLTERQQACLQGYIARKTAKEIGRDLGISHHAVEQHLKAARKKLDARDSAEAARIYLSQTNATARPYYGGSELSGNVQDRSHREQPERGPTLLRDSATDGDRLIQALSVRQTLLAIGICALGGIIILALIVAVASGVAQLAP